jgi:hypothetical protein
MVIEFGKVTQVTQHIALDFGLDTTMNRVSG